MHYFFSKVIRSSYHSKLKLLTYYGLALHGGNERGRGSIIHRHFPKLDGSYNYDGLCPQRDDTLSKLNKPLMMSWVFVISEKIKVEVSIISRANGRSR